MDSGKDCADEKYTFGKGWNSEKMLQLYIYDRMRKKGLHHVAEIFAKEVNLEMLELVKSKEGLLTEWWNVFWPQYCSRALEYNAEEDSQSSAEPTLPNLLAMLGAGAGGSEQPPTGFEKEPLGFSPAQLLTTEIIPMPPSGNAWAPTDTGFSPFYVHLCVSHQQMPVILLAPPQVVKVPTNDVSVQVESTYPESEGSTYPPVAPNADLGKLEVVVLKEMDSGKDCADEKYTFGKGWNSEKMLQLYIYDRMRKKGLHHVAEIFAKEVNLEMLELVKSKEGLLTEWWNVFWPQYCSRALEYNAEEDSQSSAEPTLPNLLAMLGTGAGGFEQPPTGFEKEPLGFSPAQLLTTEIIPMPPSGNSCHQQMPVTLLAPPQVVKVPTNDVSGERSVQVESTYPASEGSTYPPVAPNAGKCFWKRR